jgi:hypothetical protein
LLALLRKAGFDSRLVGGKADATEGFGYDGDLLLFDMNVQGLTLGEIRGLDGGLRQGRHRRQSERAQQ